jgi:aspartate racemase
MTQPKMIGLLGGMGWPSTVMYYSELNRRVQRRLGGSHSARVLIWSDDFADAVRILREERWLEASVRLASAGLKLQRAGAEVIAIACNSMHRVADDLQSRLDVPVLNIAEAVAEEIQARGYRTLGLMGTNVTLDMPLYPRALASRGLKIVFPGAEYRKKLDHAIYTELSAGVVSDQALEAYQECIRDLRSRGAETTVLACTELGLLASRSPDRDVLDTASVHIDALVAASLADGETRRASSDCGDESGLTGEHEGRDGGDGGGAGGLQSVADGQDRQALPG